jgi:hypothetical protein
MVRVHQSTCTHACVVATRRELARRRQPEKDSPTRGDGWSTTSVDVMVMVPSADDSIVGGVAYAVPTAKSRRTGEITLICFGKLALKKKKKRLCDRRPTNVRHYS